MSRPIPNLGINLCDVIEIKKILWATHKNRTGLSVGFCSCCGATSDGWPNKPCEIIESLFDYTKQLDHLIQDYKKGDLDSILKSLEFLSQNSQTT